MKLAIVIHDAEEGGYWAEIPALPGCVSQGETADELIANIREAAAGWLEARAAQFSKPPNARVMEVAF
jgi:predicted RNase H-like HicB family nuclease